ncbi:cell division ATP-binding protein FtsE [Cryobacterium arcticum]|uniref:Cell division ATP-binding protein FtsE n=1 Tax=Cryobacterium arcticum TaxID=670052 RepID=A0A1B1BL82_9MICO|nr:cell division ATP-binding protein FtsE [Cryobacterium arcticum]ANP73266.1 ABC transporter ATP-binding protein [Cryobacterium arcticum]
MIRFDHITKKYPGTNRPALNSIDVEILRGEFVFLVGASGSGKSSCLRLMLKEEKPSSGSIHVLGQDLRSISNRKVPYFRRNLGVVFQDFRLLPNKSVYDNVAFSLQVIGKSRGYIQEAVPDTLQMVGLAEKAQRLPHELSGGEQQRVAIARAIVNKPQIVLADEPTGNLDPTTSAEIMSLLARINAGGTTVIMATHEAGIVDKMKRRVIELSAGQIVRDERQGGYATAAIPMVLPPGERAPSRSSRMPSTGAATGATTGPSTGPTPAAPLTYPAPEVLPQEVASAEVEAAAVAVNTAPPAEESEVATTASVPERHAEPAAAQPVAVEREAAQPVAAQQAPVVEYAQPVVEYAPPAEAEPAEPAANVEPPASTMSRPVIPVTQHDEPEQLTLAEKLGLRAPGEKPDPTIEQNVGPTR